MSAAATAVASAVTLGADALGHRYARERGLEPVSFRLEGPGLVAVVGANGACKTTLLRILAGLLRPNRGHHTLALDGAVVPPAARRKCVGFVSPELRCYPELTVSENLGFAAEARGLARPAQRVEATLARVGLSPRAADRVETLSSGLTQRLRLATALLHEPALLLLDEPGSHLDDAGRTDLETILAEEGRRHLVVIATNEPKEWSLAARRIELSGRGVGHPA